MGNSASLIVPAREQYQEDSGVTSDNRERAGWLVNQGHGVWEGGQRGAGHGVVAAQFTGAGVCSTEVLCFCFWYCRACSPSPKLDLGVHREVSCSVQSWRPLQCPAGGEDLEHSLIYWFCSGNQSEGAKAVIRIQEKNRIYFIVK